MKQSVVSLDGGSFAERAITRLKARGRKRLAVVGTPGVVEGEEKWRTAVERHGREMPLWAYHEVSQSSALTARYLVRILFRKGMPDRPGWI